MRLRVVLNRFSPAIDEAEVLSWHKGVGDSVAYGEPLCDLMVREVTRMRRPISALSKKKEELKYGKVPVQVPYRLTSLDSGVLVTVSAEPGTVVSVGDCLAVLDDGAGDGEGDGRSVVNLLEEDASG